MKRESQLSGVTAQLELSFKAVLSSGKVCSEVQPYL
jgi:hypothetical protein